MERFNDVPVYVDVPGETVYITPSELERLPIEHPIIKGSKWGDILVLLGDYEQSLNSCNSRIERIWASVEAYNND